MASMDIQRPISGILDGPNSYTAWSQGMRSFLKGRKLWRYVIGDVKMPVQKDDEDDDKFYQKLEDWDSNNHQIITWFRNTSVPSIHLQFGRYETAKEVWDMLATRFTSQGLSQQYQLWQTIQYMKQGPTQTITDFHAQMQIIWDQLAQSEPSWTCTADAVKYETHRDHMRLIQFLMALTPEYESTRSMLLHRTPLPTMDAALSELQSAETRLYSQGIKKTDTVLVSRPDQIEASLATSTQITSHRPPGTLVCKYCHQNGHLILYCPSIECNYCHKRAIPSPDVLN